VTRLFFFKNAAGAARAARLVSRSAACAALMAGGALALLAGCPGPDPVSTTCGDYTAPASFDALAPAVSFSRDVLPIFAQSCAFSTCHGATVGPANGVFLGRGDAARVHAAIVGVKGDELPSMPFVTPGDPRQSYLMRKMDGSQCALDSQCTGGSCQGSMPKSDVPLELATRDVVRRWIAQGAKND
jgi:hypothetical protein